MISELLRPVLRFLFWNRRRPAAAAVILIIAIAVTARAVSGGTHGHGPPPRPARPPATAPAASRAPASPPAASPARTPEPPDTASPPAAGPAPSAAIGAAEAFMAAWVSSGPGRTAQLRALATPRLAAQLTQASNAGNPATAVTGPPAVTSRAPGTVSFSVPTSAGPALLTVQLTGTKWLTVAVMLARTGN